jgi:hypothetical protein
MMPGVGMDRFQAGGDYLDHLMLAAAHELRERCAHTSLIVGDQDPHGRKMAEVRAPAEGISWLGTTEALLPRRFLAIVAR